MTWHVDAVAFVMMHGYGYWNEMNRNNLIALTVAVVNYNMNPDLCRKLIRSHGSLLLENGLRKMAIKDNLTDFMFLGLLLLWGSNWHLPQKVSLKSEYFGLLEQVWGEWTGTHGTGTDLMCTGELHGDFVTLGGHDLGRHESILLFNHPAVLLSIERGRLL